MRRPRFHLPHLPRLKRRPNPPDENKLRILFYNQCFGVSAAELFPNAACHLLYAIRHPRLIRKLGTIDHTVEMIRRLKPDVAAVSEVLESQREALTEALAGLGFDYVHHGKGWEIRQGEHLETVLATRDESEQIELPEVDSGGGIVSAHMPEFDADLVFLHAPNFFQRKYWEVLTAQANKIRTNKRLVVGGDFNTENLPQAIQQLELYTPDVKSFPTNALMRLAIGRKWDKILGTGFKKLRGLRYNWKSDHTVVGCEVATSLPNNI